MIFQETCTCDLQPRLSKCGIVTLLTIFQLKINLGRNRDGKDYKSK